MIHHHISTDAIMFKRKSIKDATGSVKKKIAADHRNYHVTQPAEDPAAREKQRLATGMVMGGQTVMFVDGVLSISSGARKV
jgi:hypothetical protein